MKLVYYQCMCISIRYINLSRNKHQTDQLVDNYLHHNKILRKISGLSDEAVRWKSKDFSVDIYVIECIAWTNKEI